MKYLIRFEDTYGMADLFSAVSNIPYNDIAKVKKLIRINDDFAMLFGLSAVDCLKIKTRELGIIGRFKPEYIITIMDLDKEQNDGTGILSYNVAKMNLKETEKRMKNQSPNSKIRYIPTVYASETIMIYQYLKRTNKNFCIEEIVHNKNTWIFHSIIIAVLAGLEKVCDAKRVRDYLDLDNLLESFRNTLDKYRTENKEIMKFMLDKEYLGIELEEFLDKIRDIDKLFRNYMNIGLPFEICDIPVTSNDNLFSKKELFPNFPSSYR